MFRSSKMAHTLAVGLLAVGLVGGAACSSDGSDDAGSNRDTTTMVASDETTVPEADVPAPTGATDDPQDYIDELTAAVSSDGIATPDQGQCIGRSWVETIGFDAIVAADVSPVAFGTLDTESYLELGLSNEQAGEIYGAFEGCGLDFPGIFRELSTSPDLSDEQQACVNDALNDEAVQGAFIKGLVEVDGDQELQTVFAEAEACMA
ncbi:MAG: hypothetical protein ABI239_02085 [Aquihabitans sp.]